MIYIRIIEAKKMHYFSTLFLCTTLHVSDRPIQTNTNCCEYSVKTPDDGQ
jgi:hypothetical protein